MNRRDDRWDMLYACAWGIVVMVIASSPAWCEAPVAYATTPDDPSPAVHPAVEGDQLLAFSTPLFAGSGQCAACHRMIVTSEGVEITIDADWRSAMMAQAARDPLYLATVEDELAHFPKLGDTIQQTCSRCHMPMAHTEATTQGLPVAMFGDGFLNPAHRLHDAAVDGVSCTMCHQIQDGNLGKVESFSGGFVVDTTTPKPDRHIFGPHEKLSQMMMRMFKFVPVHGAHISESKLCAVCHTLYTPTVNEKGEISGSFPEQTAFLEWQHSGYAAPGTQARSCRDCHMPQTSQRVVKAQGRAHVPASAAYHPHHFVGGNTFMLKMLQANVEPLRLTASTKNFHDTITRAFAQLRGGASLEVGSVRMDGTSLVVDVKVNSAAGHKFPTGFPSRRAWLHVAVVDEAGLTVFESGKPLADGQIVGNDADEDAGRLEPHHAEITRSDQVQVYESILADGKGRPTYVLLRAAGYAKDNRLLPRGFDKTSAHRDIAIYGAARGDENFIAGEDTVTYRVDLPPSGQAYKVSARLLFQSVSYRYVAEVVRSSGPMAERYKTLHKKADKTPVVVAAVEFDVRR